MGESASVVTTSTTTLLLPMRAAICAAPETRPSSVVDMREWTRKPYTCLYSLLLLSLDSYALNVTATAAPGSAGSSSAACSPTSPPGSHILNGGFEEGLADWTAVAYNASSSAFDVGLTNETMEGCIAL